MRWLCEDVEDDGAGEDVEDNGTVYLSGLRKLKFLQCPICCEHVVLSILPHPCENSNAVHAHSKEAIYLVNTYDHYEPVRRM